MRYLKQLAPNGIFLPFKPGLVGGHCIGVDPYYLAQKAQESGYHPEIILAGRRINDSMGEYVAFQVVKLMLNKNIKIKNSNILILGFTFKENCPDFRNTKVIDIYTSLKNFGINVNIYDPWVNKNQVKDIYDVKITNNLYGKTYDSIIVAVFHSEFKKIDFEKITNIKNVIYDVKGFLNKEFIHCKYLWKKRKK